MGQISAIYNHYFETRSESREVFDELTIKEATPLAEVSEKLITARRKRGNATIYDNYTLADVSKTKRWKLRHPDENRENTRREYLERTATKDKRLAYNAMQRKSYHKRKKHA